MKTQVGGAILLLTTMAALAACSSEVTVGQEELADQLTEQITPDNPEDEVTVECDGDLAGEVGALQDCPAMVGEEPVTARVVVTAVDGTNVEYEITPVIEPADVASTIQETLEGQSYPVESVECEGELVGENDKTALCTVTDTEGEEVEVQATVTSVDGFLIGFDFNQTS